MRRLRGAGEAAHPELASPDSPTQRVGGKPREGFVKVRHSSPMLSLDNALNEAELREFDRRVRELLGGQAFRYVTELKMDGLSMAAHYREGSIRAGRHARRWNHRRRRHRKRAHHPLPAAAREDRSCAAFEVRGETVMNRRAFERLNAERDEKGLSRFANPRNAAAGSLRVLEPQDHRLAPPGLLHLLSARRGPARLRQPLGIARMSWRAWASR